MQQLSEEGRARLNDIAARYGLSFNAVEHLLMAVVAGQGSQAQFNHPELGGMGQWSQGGMTMVGDMFNNGLKATVSSVCGELAGLVGSGFGAPMQGSFQSQSQGGGMAFNGGGWSGGGAEGVSLFVPGSGSRGQWWPEALGQPASTGAQNDMRYAFFPATRRLAISVGGRVTVYDTRDHAIGGFSQQQGGDQSLSFTSQHGLVRVSDLAVVDDGQAATPTPAHASVPAEPSAFSGASETLTGSMQDPAEAPRQDPTPTPLQAEPPTPAIFHPPAPEASQSGGGDDIFDKIERLAGLHAKGILTDREFEAKKAELLARL